MSADSHEIHVFIFQVKVKAKELRGKKKEELLKQLDELKTVRDASLPSPSATFVPPQSMPTPASTEAGLGLQSRFFSAMLRDGTCILMQATNLRS